MTGNQKNNLLSFKDSVVLAEDVEGKEILKDILKSASSFLKEKHDIDLKSVFF